ncbi:3-phosphoserine/phosphohydroxythreonine transaminase [Bacillus timonensis]|nr:3-phosphoserine/phosphohydroxythreonine transaminase [Bacillus timonensis]
MMKVHNFNAGPAALPQEVLQKAQAELIYYGNSGISVLEMSHRSKEYEEIHERAKDSVKELLHIPSNYEVVFLQGGASLQFSMVPMNFLPSHSVANYVVTGSWSEKALKEAKRVGKAEEISSSKAKQHSYIPHSSTIIPTEGAAYVHITSNNTIYGTQWHNYPKVNIPLIADMSSDILSKMIDVTNFSLIYAGAQKNLGPAGVTLIIIERDFLKRASSTIPTMLQYKTHVDHSSLYHTPPTFSIYLLTLVLDWMKNLGGVTAIEKINQKKSSLLYQCIDDSGGFYSPHAQKEYRSMMNATFTLLDDKTTEKFLDMAKKEGFIGLEGHRSIGGCRASIYNAVPLHSVEVLVEFMRYFQKTN